MHTWNVTPKEAIAIQKELREKIICFKISKPIHHIGGADVSMNRFAKDGFAGFVTLAYPELKLLSHSVVKEEIRFPYIPGLLSFREIPMLLHAWKLLDPKPDVVIMDGVGIAHPRRIGIASHLGLVLDVPTIGCAKSVLTGVYEEPEQEPASISYMYDPKTKEIIGAALRTKRGVKPVFVSTGHLITLEESIDIVRHCSLKHRLPEPTRLAHLTVNEYRIRERGTIPM